MAKAKNGCLGWIIIAGAIIAWLSGGHGDRTAVTSVPIINTSPTVSSTQVAPSSAPQATTTAPPVPAVTSPTDTREASTRATSGTTAKPPAPAPGRLMLTTANVRLRSSDAADAPIVTTLRKGTAVEVVGTVGDRLQVNVPSLNVAGWVHKSYLAESLPPARAAPALAATEQVPPKPKASAPKATRKPSTPAPGTPIRDPVYGSCDCPYDYARNGSRCGGRSAYSRPGGREPICFYE